MPGCRTPNAQNLGKIIKEARLAKKITQEQLAELIGVCDDRLIRMWESGERSPSRKHRRDLARFLDLSPEILGV